MSEKIIPVIMAGGKGTRLWPLSRAEAPKQFLQFLGDLSLFQRTLNRVSDPALYEPAVIVTNADFRFLVAEQARNVEAPLAAILLEPVARNTAPALAAAAFAVLRDHGPEGIMQVLASDHEIAADDSYFDCIRIARETAAAGKLVTFGIKPTEPATGYGYIETGDTLATGAHKVSRFIEKPNLERARALLADGRYLWNSGMFMLPVGQFLADIRLYAPGVHDAAQKAVQGARHDLDFIRLDEESFARAPDISVDYAVFEKTPDAAVVPSGFRWSDLGSWDSVWAIGEKDADGNVLGEKVTVNNTRNSLVLSRDIHIAVQGLKDVAVIASEDAVYIGPLADSQNVGHIVKRLAASKATSGLTQAHPTSYRPWGSVASVLSGARFEVKKLLVRPGASISLQKHHHRSEHWIVVRGTAEVIIDGDVRLLHENQSVDIPEGTVHRLRNPGKIPLELIEVQTGSYLGDDDIIRLDDQFGRT